MSGSPPSIENRYARAEALIADLIERQVRGELVDLDGCIAAHAELEHELRELGHQLDLVNRGFDAELQRTTAERAEVDHLLAAVTSKDRFSDRYSIEAEVGQGGMGIVYRVLDRKLDRPLALKVIRGKSSALPTGQTPAFDPRQIARFLNEAKITGQLDHPGIVPVHEVGVDQEGRAYFTMKLVKGRTLGDVLELRAGGDESWALPRVLGLIQRVCEAMAFAHEHGVIHRDLKPANVMVGDFGEVYVMDWGLARRIGDVEAPEEVASRTALDEELSPQATLTRDGDQVGTPAYMSPEQARGEIARMGPKSDVYSIGAMLYELIGGAPPYVKKGERSSGALILTRVIAGPPKELLSPEVPPELLAICHKAIERDPERRYERVRELGKDVERFLAGRSVRAFRTGAWVDLQKWVKRNKALASSLAAALLLLVAGLTASLIFKSRSDENARVAQINAKRASDQEQVANQRAADLAVATRIAQENADEATKKANDVLSLSAIQDLKELQDRADKLWPAYPEMVPAYEKWLEDARVLIEGRPASPAQKAKPSLAQHEANLQELRKRAQPLTPDQVEVDRRASPKHAELEKAQGELTWMRRMLGAESWPSDAEVEAELAVMYLPESAEGLNNLAWPLVDVTPGKVIYGAEVRARILAQRAVDLAGAEERASIRDTLALALWRCGRFEEAFAQETKAIEEAKGKERAEYEMALGRMRELASARWQGEERRSERARDVADLAASVATLEKEVSERRTYQFEEVEDGWWFEQLSKLVGDLRAFTDEKSGGLYSHGTSETSGWGILKRLEFARGIEMRSVSGHEAGELWASAIRAIAVSEKYRGLKLTPHMGILPLGVDPASELWEFVHLQSGSDSGAVPVRGADGRLQLSQETGIVLILIPRTLALIGEQVEQLPFTIQVNDEKRKYNEHPHKVRLSSYFISKFEMTQGQWLRLTGSNPSHYGPNNYSALLNCREQPWTSLCPVESVNWYQASVVLWRSGLRLPNEAEWEVAARGGSSTAFWTGDSVATLRGAANLADECFAIRAASNQFVYEKEFDDGYCVPAPVGTYSENGYGLCDVVGNVWEWCHDGFYANFYHTGIVDNPIAPPDESPERVIRGGGFNDIAINARSATRFWTGPETKLDFIGMRAAMSVYQ